MAWFIQCCRRGGGICITHTLPKTLLGSSEIYINTRFETRIHRENPSDSEAPLSKPICLSNWEMWARCETPGWHCTKCWPSSPHTHSEGKLHMNEPSSCCTLGCCAPTVTKLRLLRSTKQHSCSIFTPPRRRAGGGDANRMNGNTHTSINIPTTAPSTYR